VKFEWEITEGEGNFVQLGCLPETRSEEGNYVIFQPPYVPIPDSGKNRKTTIITLRIIDDNESQPIDKTIIQKITIHTDRKKWETNEDHYFITVESGDYKLP
ncbi:hypothetical protein RZS08_65080, partial [Arthrospira platensis SPKY1]|nr:hypothetical protein [Arthrospira platensis SPKY1]